MNSTICYKCLPTFLYWQYDCSNPCPYGTYDSNSTNCSSCDQQCGYCTNIPSNCTACRTSGPYRSFLLNNYCWTRCPGGKYGNTGNNQCSNCHSNCMTCWNGGNTNCYNCFFPFMLSGSTCLPNCTTGYGITTMSDMCVRCNNTCVQCSYTNTNCSSCQSSGNFTSYLFVVSSS